MGKRIGNLGLVNYADFPGNKNYKVFNFNTLKEADLFEGLLKERKIWYEKDEEDHQGAIIYLFAVDKRDFRKAQDCNFEVSGKTRKHIIPSAFFRYALLLFVLAMIVLGVVGYVKNS